MNYNDRGTLSVANSTIRNEFGLSLRPDGPAPVRAAEPRRIARIAAEFGGFLGGSLAPILTGYIAEAMSFVPALLTGAAFAFLSALSDRFLVRTPIPALAE